MAAGFHLCAPGRSEGGDTRTTEGHGSEEYPDTGKSLRHFRILVLLLALVTLAAAVWPGSASAVETSGPTLTEDSFNKMLGALRDLRSSNIPVQVGPGSVESETAKLKKQPKVERIVKKRGLSLQQFVLTYKATAQIHEAEKSRDNWQKTLVDPSAAPEAKLEATEKLGESMKADLFTPEQIELVRRRMPELEAVFFPTKQN